MILCMPVEYCNNSMQTIGLNFVGWREEVGKLVSCLTDAIVFGVGVV